MCDTLGAEIELYASTEAADFSEIKSAIWPRPLSSRVEQEEDEINISSSYLNLPKRRDLKR